MTPARRVASVATNTPARMGQGFRNRWASNGDSSCVRSPISASATGQSPPGSGHRTGAAAAAAGEGLNLRGGIDPTQSEWIFHRRRVCDGQDPEGNVVPFRRDIPTPARGGFSRIGYRSAQRELGDSCPGSKARRRRSAALTQAVVDRWHRSPNPEADLAQSMRAFHLCSRRWRNAAASSRSMYACAVPAACRTRFQSRPWDGKALGRTTAESAGLDWAFGNVRSKPRYPPSRGSLDVNPRVACGAELISSAAFFRPVRTGACLPGREQIPS
jgi:hypothetical protein